MFLQGLAPALVRRLSVLELAGDSFAVQDLEALVSLRTSLQKVKLVKLTGRSLG